MSLIKKPAELEIQTTIKILLYGQPGIGKSTLALSAPSPLLLDFDNGVHRVSPLHQVDTVQIKSWEDCLNVLKEDLSGYKTLVIDTAGKMLDYVAMHIIKKNPKMGKANGALTLQGYGERKAEFRNFLKQVSLIGKHLVFVAHDQEEKDGDNKIIRPEIGGSSAGDLVKELDLVGYMEARGKQRTISFDPCEKFYGKNTCNLDPLIELPHLELGKSNTLLTSIFDDYKRSLETRKDLVVKYNSLMGEIEEKITTIDSVEGANDFAAWAGSFTGFIWDSKIVAGMKLKAKVAELGLSYNKTSKKYEPAKIEANATA
jgi:hypothetical protein